MLTKTSGKIFMEEIPNFPVYKLALDPVEKDLREFIGQLLSPDCWKSEEILITRVDYRAEAEFIRAPVFDLSVESVEEGSNVILDSENESLEVPINIPGNKKYSPIDDRTGEVAQTNSKRSEGRRSGRHSIKTSTEQSKLDGLNLNVQVCY